MTRLSHDELAKRISAFTALARERELTLEEQSEREALRKEYLQRVKANMRASLEGIERKK